MNEETIYEVKNDTQTNPEMESNDDSVGAAGVIAVALIVAVGGAIGYGAKVLVDKIKNHKKKKIEDKESQKDEVVEKEEPKKK